ncbi:MAG: PAS-domain containing protein [Sneathiellaceae bacterium]
MAKLDFSAVSPQPVVIPQDPGISRHIPCGQTPCHFTQERGDFDHLDGAAMDRQVSHWSRLETAAEPFGYERRLADGRVLRVENRPMPGGGWLRSWLDITELRRTQAETARKTELLQLILDSIDQGVIMRDGNDNILVYNERLAEILEVPAGLYAGNASSGEMSAYHRRQDGDRPDPASDMVKTWLERRKAGDAVERLEYQRRVPGGRWIHVVFQPLPQGRELRTFSDITQIKAVEEELTEKTRFLEAVLAAMQQGVLVTDAEGRISLWNDRACQILGIPAAILESRPLAADLGEAQRRRADLDPDDPALGDYVERWTALLSRPEGAETFTHERLLPDGRWMLVYGRRLAEGGTVRTFTDITLRKRDEAEILAAKEEAERARERLQAAMDAMPAGIVILDSEMNYQTWNEVYKELSKLTDEELIRLRSFDRVAALKRDEVNRSQPVPFDSYLAERRALLARRLPAVTTEYWSSADRHIELRVNPIPTGGWVSVYLDMTSRIEAEREIAANARAIAAARDAAEATRERMRAILQTIPVGVLVYDPEQRIEFWNDAYSINSGFSREVLESKPHFRDYSEFIYHAHRRDRDMTLEAFMAYRNRVYGSTDKYLAEFHFDMTGRDVQYSVSPLPDGGRVNVIVDITQQKEAERAALEARDTAQAATRAKSAFLAAMSHEIRTPMNGVIGMAEILQQGRLTEEQRAITSTIRESGQALLRIIDDILDFSKIEAERMELEAEPVDLRAIAESVLDTLSPLAESRDLDLSLRIDQSVPAAIIGDQVRLRQVLLNLAGNAVKFTEAGSVEVTATAAPDAESPSGVSLRVEVADTGIGIERERIGQLFQPFRQAEASTTRRFGGTGLGLSICERLVTLMKGRIGVSSAPGQGTRFWFTLPLEPAVLAAEESLDTSGLAGLPVLLHHRPGPLGDAIADMLCRAGMTVTRSVAGGPAGPAAPGPGPSGHALVLADGRLGPASLAGLRPPHGIAADGPNARALWVWNRARPDRPPLPVSRPFRRAALLRAVLAGLGRASPELSSIADPLPASAAAPPVSGRTILVVEDNETNRTVVERQLGLLGFSVATATNGREALEMWREGGFGLVLTDCHMPQMDGYQLAAAIREAEAGSVPARPRTPIVALTANALVGEAERCLAAGMDDYLAKPVTLNVMGERLGRWLKQGEDSPVAARGEATGAPAGDAGPIDLARMAEILGSAEEEIVAAMLSMFAESFGHLRSRMAAAIEASDAPMLREAAHAAKGAAANACAPDLQAVLERLERAAADAHWASAQDAWREVQARGDEVMRHLAAKGWTANGLSS